MRADNLSTTEISSPNVAVIQSKPHEKDLFTLVHTHFNIKTQLSEVHIYNTPSPSPHLVLKKNDRHHKSGAAASKVRRDHQPLQF